MNPSQIDKESVLNEAINTLKSVLPYDFQNQAINEKTILSGDSSIIDSVTLLTLIVTLEENLNSKKLLTKPLVEGFIELLGIRDSVSIEDIANFVVT